MVVLAILMLLLLAYICWMWVKGIDYMKENHPDYRGDDFLHWEINETIVEFPKKEIKNVKVKVKSIKKHKPKFNSEN